MDVVSAAALIRSTMQVVKEKQSDQFFASCIAKAKAIAIKNEVPTAFVHQRIRWRKRMPGELASDEPIHSDPESRFREFF